MAHLSGDEKLQQPYKEGKDIYSTLASQVFNKPIEECLDGSEYRKKMKVGVLAVMYGISPFQLGGSLSMTTEQAEKFLNDFKDKYPKMKKFMQETEEYAVNNEYVNIEGGFKRRFTNLNSKHKAIENLVSKYGIEPENIWGSSLDYKDKRKLWDDIIKPYYGMLRQAVNARIQGGSAIMTKIAMVNIQKYFEDNGLDKSCFIVASVHDELIFELPEDISEDIITNIANIMCNALPMDIPMKSDIQYMKKWGISFKDGRQVTNVK